MYELDKAKAAKILQKQGFTINEINTLLQKYPKLDDSLGPVVEKWLQDQETPNLEVDGLILKDVMKIRRSHFLVAVRDLNQLLNPALKDEKRMQWRRILTTPVTYE